MSISKATTIANQNSLPLNYCHHPEQAAGVNRYSTNYLSKIICYILEQAIGEKLNIKFDTWVMFRLYRIAFRSVTKSIPDRAFVYT